MSFAQILKKTQAKLYTEQLRYKKTGVKSEWLIRFEGMICH